MIAHEEAVAAAAAGRRVAPSNGHAKSSASVDVTQMTGAMSVERVGLGYQTELACGIELKLTRIRGVREMTG